MIGDHTEYDLCWSYVFSADIVWHSFSVDAAQDDGSLGRLVNDDHINPNSRMKTISVDGKPHLCLFATRSIYPGEEITYDYGDSEWPWRCTVLKPLHCQF